MQYIVYYPLSIKRTGRFVYLLFYFFSGIALIYFALNYKIAVAKLFGWFYLVWGLFFVLGSVLLSIPWVYQKVYLAINSQGVFQKISFLKKMQFATWKNIKEIKVIENKIVFELEKSQIIISTEKMNQEDQQKIIQAIKYYVNEN